MGFSTIVGAIAFMFIFAGMIIFAVTVQRNLATQSQEHAVASERERVQGSASIAVTSAAYSTNTVVPWTDTTYSDFSAGTLASGATIVSPGTLTLTGPLYTLNGTWTSPIIDTRASGTNYSTISWTSVLAASTNVTIQARGGTSVGTISASSYTGPDGTTSSYYSVSGTTLNDSKHDGKRYIQYRVDLNTSNTANAPQLQEVIIGIQRAEGVSTITIENQGSEKLEFADNDLYRGGVRIPRNTTNRTIDYDATSDQILWLPGESITCYIFGTITTPAQVIVANGAARAAGTIT